MAQSEKSPTHPKIFSRKASTHTAFGTGAGGGGRAGAGAGAGGISAVPEEAEAVTEDILGAISTALAVVNDPAVRYDSIPVAVPGATSFHLNELF